MTPPRPPLTPAELAEIKRRLSVDRPLHWDAARALVDALEAAWEALAQRSATAEPEAEVPAVTSLRASGKESASKPSLAPHPAGDVG